ncbi:MAG: peptidoglycan DD-metalloendopeptidase family protein [Prevotella sp.]|nr:peptidoglycan DD-metalloendopeptidase family protein [Prevotella sp.]
MFFCFSRNIIVRTLVLVLGLAVTLTFPLALYAAPKFSPLEQQQISIETPGLFSKANAFQIDFTNMGEYEYSFPLPVGKTVAHLNGSIEIETKSGDAVKSMFSGTVRLSRKSSSYGNVIVVRHNNGLETVYALNAQNLVQSGDYVKAGQTIAIVGGKGERTYLLFQIMVDGNRINPSTLIETKSHAIRKQIVTFTKEAGIVTLKTKLTEAQVRERAEKAQTMSLDTNNPFKGNNVYRINLDLITSWHYPLDNAKVISGYGGRRRGHSGVDIKNGPGTKVYAAFDGKVVQSGVFSGYGNCITIRHTFGLETRYSHNSKNLVKVGDMVKAGQVIAIVGRTGRATTEHVHFETRIAGRAFNPNFVFDTDKNKLHTGTLQFKKNGGVVRIKD